MPVVLPRYSWRTNAFFCCKCINCNRLFKCEVYDSNCQMLLQKSDSEKLCNECTFGASDCKYFNLYEIEKTYNTRKRKGKALE